MTERFENYTIVPVRDLRETDDGNYVPEVQYAVMAHNGITVTDTGGWELPDQKVLFTSERDAYDGGRAECAGFIEGYKQGLPQRMTNCMVVSGSCADEDQD